MDRLVQRVIAACLMLVLGTITPGRGTLAQAPVSEPLHLVIDRMLVSSLPHLTAPPAPDALFLRRLSLDLRGAVPTGEELAAFAADTDPGKVQSWTDRFMADPLHAERMVDWLDKTLMQRRPFAQVDRNAWIAWLRQTVDAHVPLDQLVKQMLTAPWWENSQRPALRFFLDRSGDPHLITRDLSRVLLGRDMQCNQCHNHPLVEEYRQIDYHGMLAFVSNSGLAEGSTKNDKGADVKSQMYVERPAADAAFESVFEKGVAMRTGPRLPVADEIFEEYLHPDQRMASAVSPGAFAGMPAAPVQSRRKLLAERLTEQHKLSMARNFANRLWAIAFGRGLVQPLDMHHADNPPVHPELLDRLASALIHMKFDCDQFLAEIVRTQAYRRASELSLQLWPLASGADLMAGAAELQEIGQAASAEKERLAGELVRAQADDSSSEQALETASATWREAQAARHAARSELEKAEAAFNDVKKKSDEAGNAHRLAAKKHQDAAARMALLDEAHSKLQQALALATPEDAEVKAAATTAKSKADAVRAELPALEKTVSDTKAAADAALAALEAPRSKVQDLANTLAEAQKKLAPVDAAYTAARTAWAVNHARVVHMQRSIDACDDCLELVKAIDDARAAAGARKQAESELASQVARSPQFDLQVQQATEGVANAQTRLNAATANVVNAQQSLQKHEGEMSQLRETLAQLSKASALVSPPDALNNAATAITETLASRVKDTASLQEKLTESQQAMAAASTQLAQQQAARSAADSDLKAHQALIATQQSQLDQQSTVAAELAGKARQAWDKVLADQQTCLAVANVRALSPEQLGQSILRVTGIFDNYVTAEAAELDKKSPLTADADAETKAKRLVESVRGAADKLRGNIDVFANLYASGAGQTSDEFFASPDQALFMANGGAVFPWSGPNAQNITARMIAQSDNAAAAKDAYNTLLARDPSPGESSLVADQLAGAGAARAAVCQEIVWAILTGVEFRFYR